MDGEYNYINVSLSKKGWWKQVDFIENIKNKIQVVK